MSFVLIWLFEYFGDSEMLNKEWLWELEEIFVMGD